MKAIVLIIVFISISCTDNLLGQDFYAPGTIQKIEISFYQSNWDYILDTNKQGKDGYTIAQWVKINGVQFDSAGVKYKGNSSYNSNNVKNPLHIELDHFKSQDYQGYKDIKLSNGWRDPSFVREALTYLILQNYMHAPLANFAQIYINGQYTGLYSNVEAVAKTFLNSHFFTNDNSFFYSDVGGCNLVFKGNDSTFYYSPYTLKSNYGYADLMHLCDSLRNNINDIENILDVDRSLWMLAISNVLVILDSYIGAPQHNYYIYEDHNGRFNPIMWDLNGAFGTFSKLYQQLPNLTLAQKQTFPPMVHSNDTLWPLVKNLLAVPMFKRMYIAHMRTVADEILANSYYYTTAQYLQSIIDTAYQSDVNVFFTYSQFLSNLTTDVASGPDPVPGLTNLMNARISYLNSTTEFQQVAPTLSNIQPSDTFPLINSSIYIAAQVSNATAVYCGLRNSIMDKFVRQSMLDDGLNGDGAAGDGIYGTSVPVTSPEIQYYIYAENNNAGIFSPQRAEHEWYTLTSDYTTLSAGEVVINELAAMNSTIQANGLGNYGDWIELFNTSPDTVSLNSLYLSDDFLIPAKWQFPDGVVIPPNGYLVVWADNDIAMGEYHTGFKLSATGEQAILSYSNGTVIDSATFPVQSADVSYSRCPNGSGSFKFTLSTFNGTNNCSVNVEEINGDNKIIVFPNPTYTGVVNIFSPYMPIGKVYIFDFTGKKVFAVGETGSNIFSVDMGTFGSGIYLFIVNDTSLTKIMVE